MRVGSSRNNDSLPTSPWSFRKQDSHAAVGAAWCHAARPSTNMECNPALPLPGLQLTGAFGNTYQETKHPQSSVLVPRTGHVRAIKRTDKCVTQSPAADQRTKVTSNKSIKELLLSHYGDDSHLLCLVPSDPGDHLPTLSSTPFILFPS